MKDLATVPYHKISENIVDIICQKTQNNSPLFFRILVAYHLSKITSMMRVKVHSKDRGIIPINMYGINLAVSGIGKGYSTEIIESEIINTFRDIFFDQTFPIITEENLNKLSIRRANLKGEDPDTELIAVTKEFEALGPFLFSFDSATTAAVKQARHKLLMGQIGSMNFEMDEVGSNLSGNVDVMSTMLELFDVGKVKNKLTKNTRENIRNSQIEGNTPTNLLMFGTPSKLLDGSRTEDEFWSLLETGYARRCFFGYTRTTNKNIHLTAEEVYDALTNSNRDKYLKDISAYLGKLADSLNYNKVITVSKNVSLILIDYHLECDRKATALREHQDMRKAELSHRYFKVLKLAGMYSFIDGHSEVSEDNLYSAIKLAEESGEAFQRLLKRDKNYVKLAKFIADTETELTHTDLMEDLPFYKGSSTQRADMLLSATAWGYKNRILIKKSYTNGVEFISGETLQKTNLNSLPIALSDDITINYKNLKVPFNQLNRLAQKNDLHWVAHHLKDGYRSDDNIIPGFNLVVLDVDNGITMEEVKALLKDYTCLIYTTKRHTPLHHRFRIIMPTNYTLKLDSADYKEFMSNIYEWLPFSVDEATFDRPRKWMTCNGHHEYINGGELIDVMEFIPKTTRNDDRKKIILDTKALSNIERWFISNTGNGNRSNQLIRYAFMLVDIGRDFTSIRSSILSLNNKLKDNLTEHEVDSTIMLSVSKALAKKP